MNAPAMAPGLASSRGKLMSALFAAQVCGSTGHSIMLAVGSIMAASITGTNTWSGLPIAVGALGTALASWPLASLMNRAGRRPGLALGYGLAVVGAVLGMLGVVSRSFALLLGGMALFGIAGTSNLVARYAAADVSPGAQLGRAMGLIVWGSTIGSVVLAPGSDRALIILGLFLNGVGWNFAFVAGSALLTDALSTAERASIQGLADLVMGLMGALGSAAGGMILGVWGFAILNAVAAALVLGPLAITLLRRPLLPLSTIES
jgi:MFS family permease